MDNQGTIRDIIDNDGTVINHISYDSFGQITEQSNTTAFFRFGYTGREFDTESGQYYYRARYFDPRAGRFINEDTIGFRAGDTNLYRYVGNSSPNYIDPTGNFSISQFANDVLTSDLTYDLANRYDQFFAGFGDVASFGATTKIREAAYGETATRNHQGGLFTSGQVAGGITSFAVGAGAPSSLRGVTIAQRFAQGHTVVGAGVGAYQSTRNIIEGCATWWDALSFAPAAGYGANKAAPHLRNLAQSVNFSAPPSGSLPLKTRLSQSGAWDEAGYFRPGVFLPAARKAGDIRNTPGLSTGGTNLPIVEGRWLKGTHGNLGLIPKQIAGSLSGQKFSSFDQFRSTFWKSVASDSKLSSSFSKSNQNRMFKGLAPKAHTSQHFGGKGSYELHHKTPIHRGGGVYDLDNIAIVTPRMHQSILNGDFHFGN